MFYDITGVYHKLVTTGKENKEPEEIDTLLEEPDGDAEAAGEPVIAPRTDVKRKSNRRVHRHHSIKRGNNIYDNKKVEGPLNSNNTRPLHNFFEYL